jgi:tyrosyl-tRNA synthetase
VARPGKPTTQLGTYGERVGRERAARRRAARDNAAREQPAPRPEAPPQRADIQTSDPIAAEPEIIEIPQSDLANELSVLAALIMAGLARSHPEARRRFREDGIAVNDTPVLSDKAKLRPLDVSPDGVIKLALGSGRSVLLRPV